MPKLMDKKDRTQTVAELDTAANIWYENVVGSVGDMSVSLPETGRYRVILVKLDDVPRTKTTSRIGERRKISPRVRALRGAARLDDHRDYKEILADALAEKYGALE